ncbi:MAG TPA: hypothetical protein VF870_08530, partial [Ignavibacteriaceae bacterium]
KKILNITVTEFELIVNKIDRELFMLHQSKLVDNALFAIADYFSIGGLNKSTVSVEAVENFLKEKNLTELLFKLKRAYTNTSKKKVDIDEIRKVLYSTLSIDSPFVEDGNQAEVIADEKHFDNPLKEEFVNEEESAEVVLTEDENSSVDEILTNPASGSESVQQLNEENNVESPSTQVETIDENSFEGVEEALAASEPEKFEINTNDVQSVEIPAKEIDELEITEMELMVNDQNPVEENESPLIESVDEEDLLNSLTEDIEKDKGKDDEIIILDEKEQEDLLNFYDNELEISIDDDVPVVKDKKSEIDENRTDEMDILEFEPEQNNDESTEDEVPIEKIDFEKDLLGVDKSEESDVEEDSLIEPESTKSSADVFTYLSKKEIDRIIKNLFNSDSEDFANTVEKMSLCKNYEEASAILDNIFKYARIKPHSRDAASLTNAVAKYFNTEK